MCIGGSNRDRMLTGAELLDRCFNFPAGLFELGPVERGGHVRPGIESPTLGNYFSVDQQGHGSNWHPGDGRSGPSLGLYTARFTLTCWNSSEDVNTAQNPLLGQPHSVAEAAVRAPDSNCPCVLRRVVGDEQATISAMTMMANRKKTECRTRMIATDDRPIILSLV